MNLIKNENIGKKFEDGQNNKKVEYYISSLFPDKESDKIAKKIIKETYEKMFNK